jgi:hypothetical protein
VIRYAALLAAVVAGCVLAALDGTAQGAYGSSRWLGDCGPVTTLPPQTQRTSNVRFSFAYAPRPLRSGRTVTWVIHVANPSRVWWHLEFAAPSPADVLLGWPSAPRVTTGLSRWTDVAYAWSLAHGIEGGPRIVRELRPRTGFTCVLKDVLNVKPGRYKLLAMLNLATPGAPFIERRTIHVLPTCGRPCE